MAETTSELQDLDKYCSNIVVALYAERKMRFSKLYDKLRRMGLELSRPTLVEHLRHLQSKGWVSRKIEGVQKVAYEIKEEKLKELQLENDKEIREVMNDLLEKRTAAEKREISEVNISRFLRDLIKTYLEEFRGEISIKSKLKNLDKHTDLLFFNNSSTAHRMLEKIMIDQSLKDEHYRQELLQRIDELIQKFRRGKLGSF